MEVGGGAGKMNYFQPEPFRCFGDGRKIFFFIRIFLSTFSVFPSWSFCKIFLGMHTLLCKIERKAMVRNRYNYPTPPIRDFKGKETQTRNNWTLMETSLAESQPDSYKTYKKDV